MKLSSPCALCNSTRWCGRACKNKPETQTASLINADVAVAAVAMAAPALINNTAHQAKWRAANLDLNRQRAREGMRKLRAEKKDNDSA